MYRSLALSQLQRVTSLQHQVNPYEPEVDWFTRDVELHPLSSAPEPKRRFQPSKWEEKK
jgi:ribosome biogenesis protein ERB1